MDLGDVFVHSRLSQLGAVISASQIPSSVGGYPHPRLRMKLNHGFHMLKTLVPSFFLTHPRARPASGVAWVLTSGSLAFCQRPLLVPPSTSTLWPGAQRHAFITLSPNQTRAGWPHLQPSQPADTGLREGRHGVCRRAPMDPHWLPDGS